MAKHRAKTNSTARNAALVVATGAGLATMSPATAEAATITVPNTGVSVDVPDHIVAEAKKQARPVYDLAVQHGVLKQSDIPAPAKPAPKKAPAGKSVGQKIADIAMTKVGAPYVWGAAGPNAFDCSGLTTWAHQQLGKNIPRTSQAQAGGGHAVALNALQPGDVISYYAGASHVGIYIGGGKIVHALNPSSPVRVDDLHYMPVHNAVRF